MQTQEVADKAAALMPELMKDLEKLVAIPSVAFPGYPSEPVMQMAEQTLAMFRDVGFTNAQLMEVPTGYPPIYGEIPGPEGSPVVMLYAHYDVQPAPPEQGWTTDPWTPTTQDGRIYGRGAADDKGGLVTHLGTLQILEGKPPCTDQADRGRHGGDQQQPRTVRRSPSRALRRGPFHRLRHGQPPRGRARPDDSPARRRRLHRDRANSRAPPPLRSVRWGRPRRHDGARSPAVLARRRRGQRGHCRT